MMLNNIKTKFFIRAIFSSCRKIGFELSYGNMVLWGGDCAGKAE